jgi:Domain of unknown function (DUF1905)
LKTAKPVYQFAAKLWRYDGPGGWHFITLPKPLSAEIRVLAFSSRSSWGSVRVSARIGKTSWETSIFPDTKAGTYLLPVKAGVRKQENLVNGKRARVALTLGARGGKSE